jgi:RimJ/RimL family protein N-acetyltransferase
MSLAETLAGDRVRLEPLEPRHEEPLWAVAQNERIWRFMRTRADASREAFHAWFEYTLGLVPFATVSLATEEPIGSTSYLNVRPRDRVLEIGNTWLAPSAWRTGANAETKLLLMEHAFEREGFLRVEFKTDARNEQARAALAALPAEFEGVFRKHMLVRGGERRDSAWYAVIDEDWPKVKASLTRRLTTSR